MNAWLKTHVTVSEIDVALQDGRVNTLKWWSYQIRSEQGLLQSIAPKNIGSISITWLYVFIFREVANRDKA